MIASLAILAAEIVLVGMYLSQWRKGVSTTRLEPLLMMIYFLMSSSIVAGFFSFYRGEGATARLPLQSLVLISLLPNFVILLILVHTLGLRDAHEIS
jgi:hypothetical protein